MSGRKNRRKAHELICAREDNSSPDNSSGAPGPADREKLEKLVEMMEKIMMETGEIRRENAMLKREVEEVKKSFMQEEQEWQRERQNLCKRIEALEDRLVEFLEKNAQNEVKGRLEEGLKCGTEPGGSNAGGTNVFYVRNLFWGW
jgi:predicted RNase H-like nuclease (RuvC/YqgF family)